MASGPADCEHRRRCVPKLFEDGNEGFLVAPGDCQGLAKVYELAPQI